MIFLKFNKFLQCSLDLTTIQSFSITDNNIVYTIGDERVLNYEELKKGVIEELRINLSDIRGQSIPVYFYELDKKIENYHNYKMSGNPKNYPRLENHLGDKNIDEEFSELFKKLPNNDKLIEIDKINGGIKVFYYRENNIKRKEIIDELRNEIKIIETSYFVKSQNIKSNKLIWKGKKNQLYNVLRQLKNLDLIGNSYNNLADFLIDNVSGFEDTSKGTIEKEINKKKELPKPRRINIEPDKED